MISSAQQRHSSARPIEGATTSTSARLSTRLGLLGAALLTAGLIHGCGGGSPAAQQLQNEGQLVTQPDASIGSAYFIADTHFGGEASNLFVKDMFWGRLVNIADKSGVVMRDFVIAASIEDGRIHVPPTGGPAITFHLDRNPITDQFTLRIGSMENTGDESNEVTAGTARFRDALRDLESNLTPIFDNSLAANEQGPFSMIPRNAAIVVVFSDLLEPVFAGGQWLDGNQGGVANASTGQLNKDIVRLNTGYPPTIPFETRIILDPNHGNLADRDGNGTSEFYSTRVVISSTVSGLESQNSNPPLGVNSLGLPASLVPNEANLALRFPTLANSGLGQAEVLRNAAGRILSYSGNGSIDNSTGTLDVVRAMRSGGSLTQDPNNGFLLDQDLPSLLGDQPVDILSPAAYTGCTNCMQVNLSFAVPVCETVKVNDVLTQATANGPVSGVIVGWDASGVLVTNSAVVADITQNVVVEVVDAPDGNPDFLLGAGRLGTQFVTGDEPACFVRFSPPPLVAPATGLLPNTTAFLLFSEPMDPATIKAFDSFRITQDSVVDSGFEFAVGRVVPTADLRTFRWEHPEIPFNHTNGTSESFSVTLSGGADGPQDLSGNPLAQTFDTFAFTLDQNAATDVIKSITMRFEKPGDDLFADGLPEIRDAQVTYDIQNERLIPRPVTRSAAPADASQLLPGLMTPFPLGVQTPLTNLGSKLQTLWRYTDVGFSLTDETNFNLDVESISWSPVAGGVSTEVYGFFQVALTHTLVLPDELLDAFGFPVYPISGLTDNFANNVGDAANDPLKVVHPKTLGYVVSAEGLYNTPSGAPMLPFPLNENVPAEDRLYYTWRDTALQALGGGIASQDATGNGVPLDSEQAALGIGGGKVYQAGSVPSIGLPLLMEFRCYSDDNALGLNAFDVALAGVMSPRPNFRAFSSGGYVGTIATYVDPDNSDIASGGFNPGSTPPGAATSGIDNTFYFGELGLVTRISRAHSVWFDLDIGYTRFAEPTLEPEVNSQPPGTSVELAFRGAQAGTFPGNILAGTADGSAANLDAYGDRIGANNISYIDGESWKADISMIANARYFQFRLSFISNAATGRTAELRTLAFAYFKTNPAL